MASDPNNDRSDIVTKHSPRSVPDTVSRLTDMVGAKGMKLFAAAGTQVMVAAPLAALDLPLKVLVWAEGTQTNVSYDDPGALASRHHLGPDLAPNLAGINALTDALTAS